MLLTAINNQVWYKRKLLNVGGRSPGAPKPPSPSVLMPPLLTSNVQLDYLPVSIVLHVFCDISPQLDKLPLLMSSCPISPSLPNLVLDIFHLLASHAFIKPKALVTLIHVRMQKVVFSSQPLTWVDVRAASASTKDG